MNVISIAQLFVYSDLNAETKMIERFTVPQPGPCPEIAKTAT